MPRNRMIKVEFWDDEKLASSCSRDSRLLYIGMWNFSDDYGVCRGNVSWLQSHIFPYESIDNHDFVSWLHELESSGRIVPFSTDGESYYHIKTFLKHQTIDKPSARRNPQPPTVESDSSSIVLDEGSTLKGKGKGKEKDKEKGEGERDSPTPDDKDSSRKDNGKIRKTVDDKRSEIWDECLLRGDGDHDKALGHLRAFSRFNDHTGAEDVADLSGKWLNITYRKAVAETEKRAEQRKIIAEAYDA